MIDGYDLSNVLYSALSPVKSALTGDIYPDDRPVNSDKEDVVINVLAADNQQIQTAVCNVNLYVPPITVRTATGTEQKPNKIREKELTNIIKQVLNYTIVGDYTFYVQQPPIPMIDQATGAPFVSTRVQFSNVNIENFINF